MLKSMTGYGRGEAEARGRKFTIELKSVNHRFSDVVVRMPRMMSGLEDKIRRIVQQRIGRGRVDGFISVEEISQQGKHVKVDKELALAYYNAMKDLQEFLKLSDNLALKEVANQPDVIVVEEPEEDIQTWWPAIEQGLNEALDQLIHMRAMEGKRLAADIAGRLSTITTLSSEINQRAPQVVDDYRRRLKQRVNEWQLQGEIEEGRLAAEVAIFAERSNITEETVRLNSHLEQIKKCLQNNQPVGRKLDFILQEINREINTIGSKANDLKISSLVIDVKSELEKIREQVQNIE